MMNLTTWPLDTRAIFVMVKDKMVIFVRSFGLNGSIKFIKLTKVNVTINVEISFTISLPVPPHTYWILVAILTVDKLYFIHVCEELM